MPAPQHVALVQRLTEELNRKNAAVIDALFAPNYFAHGIPAGLPNGREALKQSWTEMWKSFPDAVTVIEDIVSDGPRFATRGYLQATHTQPFQNMPPTGRRVAVASMGVYLVENGLITVQWGIMDLMGLIQQLRKPA